MTSEIGKMVTLAYEGDELGFDPVVAQHLRDESNAFRCVDALL
jgi:hypothetical protein